MSVKSKAGPTSRAQIHRRELMEKALVLSSVGALAVAAKAVPVTADDQHGDSQFLELWRMYLTRSAELKKLNIQAAQVLHEFTPPPRPKAISQPWDGNDPELMQLHREYDRKWADAFRAHPAGQAHERAAEAGDCVCEVLEKAKEMQPNSLVGILVKLKLWEYIADPGPEADADYEDAYVLTLIDNIERMTGITLDDDPAS